jgi:hypothetical protein
MTVHARKMEVVLAALVLVAETLASSRSPFPGATSAMDVALVMIVEKVA